jgi:hypothetical protein
METQPLDELSDLVHLFLKPTGHTGFTAVTFRTVLPFTQVIVVRFATVALGVGVGVGVGVGSAVTTGVGVGVGVGGGGGGSWNIFT